MITIDNKSVRHRLNELWRSDRRGCRYNGRLGGGLGVDVGDTLDCISDASNSNNGPLMSSKEFGVDTRIQGREICGWEVRRNARGDEFAAEHQHLLHSAVLRVPS
jgi:hypothetical protein